MNGINPADKEDAAAGESDENSTPANPTDGDSAASSQADPNSQLKSQAVPLAVEIGWTMAVLYRVVEPQPDDNQPSVPDELPTEHELSPEDRKALEQGRVNVLLAQLRKLLPAGADVVADIRLSGSDDGQASAASPAPDPDHAPAPNPDNVPALNADNAPAPDPDHAPAPNADNAPALNADQQTLVDANLKILEWLACAGRDFGLAYQLGRSLRDTANPPLRRDRARLAQGEQEIQARNRKAQKQPNGNLTAAMAKKQATWEFEVRDGLVRQLCRPRVATLQEWLSTLEPYLPEDSATIVSVSIGRWSDLVSTIFDKNTPGGLRRFRGQSQLYVAGELAHDLLPQGDAWLDLLIGAASSQKLTPEGYVAAGEAALGRTARIVKRIAAHYWFVLVILAAALGGALYFAESGIGGAGRAWTEIAAVASTLGVTWKGIATAVARFSKQAEKNIYDLEKIDAMAWSVDTFPAELKLNGSGVRALRRSGILPPGPMGGS